MSSLALAQNESVEGIITNTNGSPLTAVNYNGLIPEKFDVNKYVRIK